MIHGVVKKGEIVNVIEAEPGSPFHIIFPDADAVWPMTETSGYPMIGNQARNGMFQPWHSWSFDETSNQWEPPMPKPTGEGFYAWLEDSQEWVTVTPAMEPEPEPEA